VVATISLCSANRRQVAVPGRGWVDASCVQQVPSGIIFHHNETTSEMVIEHPDGTFSKPENTCSSSVKSAKTYDSGYQSLANYYAASGDSFSYFSAGWTVPKAPSASDGQVLFFFNALEPTSSPTTILQPVLEYNNLAAGYNMASWWGPDSGGTYYHSNPLSVSSGDQIVGVISYANPQWTVTSTANGQSVVISVSSITTPQNWAFFANEVYSVGSCSDYPTSPINACNTKLVVLQSGQSVSPSFNPDIMSSDCGKALTCDGGCCEFSWNGNTEQKLIE